ncbi:MAG TPA: SWIM zinc finger family protein [Catenuloplanes sp.]|jgi:uncharacterized Zn finger protein
MPVGPDGWFDGGGPIHVEGGIKARTKRGSIGEQWWSRRFIDILEGICDPGRLARGRAYARKGQVLDFDLSPGLVVARVQGSRPKPYQVKITIEAYGDADWTRVEEALAAQALHRAKLLAGEMPTELVGVFDELGLPLFPSRLDMECSCPDWGFPCKHLSAALYVLAEAFDDDPFLVLAWRGRGREELLDALRGQPDTAQAPDPLDVEDVPLTERLGDFYSPTVSLGRLREHPTEGVTTPPELLLRVLDAPPVRVRHIPLVDLLRTAYRSLGGEPAE